MVIFRVQIEGWAFSRAWAFIRGFTVIDLNDKLGENTTEGSFNASWSCDSEVIFMNHQFL